MTHIASRGMEEVPCSFSRSFVKFEGHMGRKIDDLDPISAFPDDCFSRSSIQIYDRRWLHGAKYNQANSTHPGVVMITQLHSIRLHFGRSHQIPQTRMCLVFNSKRFYISIVIYCHVLCNTSLLPWKYLMIRIIIYLFVWCVVCWKRNASAVRSNGNDRLWWNTNWIDNKTR